MNYKGPLYDYDNDIDTEEYSTFNFCSLHSSSNRSDECRPTTASYLIHTNAIDNLNYLLCSLKQCFGSGSKDQKT